MEPGHCWKCGQFDDLGEHDSLCESCYEVLRWEELSADDNYSGGDDPTDHINYNPPIGHGFD